MWDEVTQAAAAPPLPPAQANEDPWITRRDLSERIHVPEATLAQWGYLGKGPKYAKFGRHARYRLSDVIAWENEQFTK
ncbi:hypothetical protein A5731_22785 [Mycolicibacterium conceptionense]|uniref:Helix-turn-helix domain-containing protein n=1 Tax=Mycolicibacterium conceptionense TaxID=451644 RepID=A0A1A1X7I3_9MYCO|nr:hypothetical protein A5718_07755 [Mycolicibacterium conceptionense]OBE98554.1 hypothetical protein A5731_22785 [Mycolicibacterium conceptionense]OBF15090.1 hypothetical protein A5726_23025 [Mycolicibacterium conceptionense]OBF30776.1 hypothetical protein A5720_29660 [Mycolicibacterium conceptionense]OBH95044.1 hypothetical protein A5716_23360 [Mycolicibacterium conceptionense]